MCPARTRPFINKRIDALEELFESATAQLALLKLLADELQYRSKPRAVALRRKVALAIVRHSDGDPEINDGPLFDGAHAQTEADEVDETDADVMEVADDDVFEVDQDANQATDIEADVLDIDKLTDGEIEASEPVDVVEAPIGNEAVDIVDAWTALEVLSPQTYNNPAELWDGDYRSMGRLDNARLPWEIGETARPNTRLYYYVPLGAIRVDETTVELLKKFGDPRPERRPASGLACLACITVDKRGRPLAENAIAVSSFGFGYHQTRLGCLDKLKNWPTVEIRVLYELKKRLVHLKDGEIQPLTKELIKGAFDWLCATFGLVPAEVERPYFALRVYHHFALGGEPEPLLLNSFYLDDLARVRHLITEDAVPLTLRQYLGIEQPDRQIDLLNDREAIEDLLAPQRTPIARWPTRGGHSLVLLQQAAVNAAREHLKGRSGLFAVNGPPGTGKTTLLRDMVADIVFTRAEALAKFDNPNDAFKHGGRYPIGGGFRHLYEIDDSLRGHEIIVASTNNKAVENVSRELPERNQIELSRAPNYFPTIADHLAEKEQACWGLAAAVLGNSKNRYEFQTRFWKDADRGLSSYLYAAQGNKPVVTERHPRTGAELERISKIIELENPPQNPKEALKRWEKTRNAFRQCRKNVEARLKQLAIYREALAQFPSLQDNLSLARTEASIAREAFSKAKQDYVTTRDTLSRYENAFASTTQQLTEHHATRPGFFSRLFKTAAYGVWQQTDSVLRDTRSCLSNEVHEAENRLHDAEKQVHAAQIRAKKCDELAANLKERLNTVRAALIQADAELGDRLADDAFWERSHEDFQVSTAWLDNETQRLRDEAFAAAFDLHRAFIGAAAKQIRHNLNCLFDVLRGKTLTDERLKVLPSLWTTLFLVTPVVSTTFASVGRMLRPMPPESLGWLLIDEAGQALPQAAAGALMRTRRAVIVGDPLQIEPVVTLSPSLVEKLSKAFGVDPFEWTAPTASAQRIADRAGPYAAVFEREDADIHVGAPLLVHRRCEQPMFGISNAISYGRKMVSAVQAKPSAIANVLGPSSWMHLSSYAGSKWSAQEGEAVLDMLGKLADAGIEEPDMFIITPFRVVQDRMRQLVMKHESLIRRLSKKAAREWAFERVGTVHTFQGREAEAVIFVLGAPNENQKGARRWAGWPPNIVNVAVTRAKRALYIVGNRQHWNKHGAFERLSARLPQ